MSYDQNINDLLREYKSYDNFLLLKDSKGFALCFNTLYSQYKCKIDFLLKENMYGLIHASPYVTFSEQLIKSIITFDVRLIEYIPRHHMTDELIFLALETNYSSLYFIEKKKNVLDWIVKQIDAYPDEKKSEEKSRFLKYFQANEQTGDIILLSVYFNPLNYSYVKNQTEDLSWDAIRIKPSVIQYVFKPTEEMILFAIEKEPLLFKEILPKFQTVDICLLALKKEPSLYSFVNVVENPDQETTLNNLLKTQLLLKTL